jgi:hypothetical protein
MSNTSTDYNMQLAASVQRDYLQSAANYRLAKEIGTRKNIISAAYEYVLGQISQTRNSLPDAATSTVRSGEGGETVAA